MRFEKIIGILFGIGVIANAAILIGVIGGWAVAVFMLAGLHVIIDAVTRD